MPTKTWNGTNSSFDDASAWSPAGVPQPGDIATIDAGTVAVSNTTLRQVTVQVRGVSGSAPTLNLINSSLAFGSTIAATNTASNAGPSVTIGVSGAVVNDGAITLTGSRFSLPVAGLLNNRGALDIVNASPFLFSAAGTPLGTVQNDGMLAVWNPTTGFQSVVVDQNVTGTGVIQLNRQGRLDLPRAVGAGQTVEFTGGAGAGSILQIDQPGLFQATISGFAQSDLISISNTPYTSFTYTSTGPNSGTFALLNGGTAVASIPFSGVYQQSDFSLVFNDFGSGRSNLQITTSASPVQNFSFTNAALNLSSSDPGIAYTGPVAGLQHQYIWNSSDAVAIAATTPNVFLKGGAGGDALAVSSGINVLDGGGGSNFLVGGTGAGSQDTFFVDGRGSVETWSTIVNFHSGDQATIFGFHPGTSTLPFTASDGATGFEGLTIHSELNGAGSGINGSITFTGLTQAVADAHFSITSGTLLPGTPDALDYLLIQYNR